MNRFNPTRRPQRIALATLALLVNIALGVFIDRLAAGPVDDQIAAAPVLVAAGPR